VVPGAARRRQEAGAILVDVREPAEWREGHAAQARHIPLGQLSEKLGMLPRDSEVLFICRSGNRSAKATGTARAAGFSATNVSGGTDAWVRAGLPIER
jgi:rhodanese-related sulfurtransferase